VGTPGTEAMKYKLLTKHERYRREKLRLQEERDIEKHRQQLHEQSRAQRQQVLAENKIRRRLGWKVKRLTPDTSPRTAQDYAALRYLAMNLNYESVARATGLPYVRVYELTQNRKAQKMIHDQAQLFQETLRERIQAFAPIAEQFLEDLISGKLEGASTALRAKYANLALARAGFGEIKNVNIMTAQLTREDIEQIKARAIAAANDAGIIDTACKELE